MSKFVCLECGTIMEPLKGVKILECRICNEKLNIQSLFTFEASLGLLQSKNDPILIVSEPEEDNHIKNCYSGTLGDEEGYLIMLDREIIFFKTKGSVKNKPEKTLEIPYESLMAATDIGDSMIKFLDSAGNHYYFQPRVQTCKKLEDDVKGHIARASVIH